MTLNENLKDDSGVEKDILELMPETKADLKLLPEEKKACVICMNQYKQGEKILTIPCCHIYHSECIKDWFKSNDTCPICKFKLDRKNLGLGSN
jgi:hypothetical protein